MDGDLQPDLCFVVHDILPFHLRIFCLPCFVWITDGKLIKPNLQRVRRHVLTCDLVPDPCVAAWTLEFPCLRVMWCKRSDDLRRFSRLSPYQQLNRWRTQHSRMHFLLPFSRARFKSRPFSRLRIEFQLNPTLLRLGTANIQRNDGISAYF